MGRVNPELFDEDQFSTMSVVGGFELPWQDAQEMVKGMDVVELNAEPWPEGLGENRER